MPAIDHLVLVSPSLDAGVEHVRTLTGVTAEPGGSHPGRGTHNALASLDAETYLEIIGIDPEQSAPSGPLPFGLTVDSPMRLATFAIRPVGEETIDEISLRLRTRGFEPGRITPMSRTRPDGVELHWHLTIAHEPNADGIVPFVIDWGDTPNPATALPLIGPLLGLRASHPQAEVRSLLTRLDPRIAVEDGPPGLVAEIAAPAGTVTLR